jgi:hypothetical protein
MSANELAEMGFNFLDSARSGPTGPSAAGLAAIASACFTASQAVMTRTRLDTAGWHLGGATWTG